MGFPSPWARQGSLILKSQENPRSARSKSKDADAHTTDAAIRGSSRLPYFTTLKPRIVFDQECGCAVAQKGVVLGETCHVKSLGDCGALQLTIFFGICGRQIAIAGVEDSLEA